MTFSPQPGLPVNDRGEATLDEWVAVMVVSFVRSGSVTDMDERAGDRHRSPMTHGGPGRQYGRDDDCTRGRSHVRLA
jgi:hypothetical protein